MARTKKNRTLDGVGPKRCWLKGPSLTVAGAEAVLGSLQSHVSTDQVVLPTQGQGLFVGGEVALIQFLSTWRSKFGQLILRTYATQADEVVQVERLSRRLYGMAGALSSTLALRYDDGEDITKTVVAKSLSQLEKMWSDPVAASRGQTFEMLCADHVGKSSPDYLYKVDGKGIRGVKPLDDFKEVTADILEAVLAGTYRGVVPEASADAISGMLWEIFRNTEEHGRVTLEGNQLPCSLRGFQARKHSVFPEQLEKLTAGFGPLREYCSRIRPREGGQQVHFFELSVFDSGIGFAQSLKKKKLSSMELEEEFKAVSLCFGAGSRKDVKGHGEGLPHVVRLLRNQRGFLRLRTGRLSLYADFGGPEVETPDGSLQLLPWHLPGTSKGVQVAGTVLTVLFPLDLQS